ncbi:MAG: hypothetical protein HFI91_13120 [Lachnospiraceae bacterium]|nr:hypothetical protein [Lachnospiraceae bacterium]
MKCFNHTEREAVATCQKCGKGLCRECAEKHTPCLCDPCAVQIQYDQQQQAQNKEEQRKQKYKAALADSRGDFIKTAIIGILVGIFFVRWDVHGGNGNVDTSFIDNVGMFCVAFCIPFGWRFITYLQSFFPISLFGTLTCLNFHLLRCCRSTMPPHRLPPPPCRLKIHSALFG